MGRKRTSGLFKKRGIWQIDKQIMGHRVRESTGTSDLLEAEFILSKHIDDLRQSIMFGTRRKHTFCEAAERYEKEKQSKLSLKEDKRWIKVLKPFIGDLTLENIHRGTLQLFIEARQRDKVKNRTINAALQTVRQILNLAASEWMDDGGLTWLANAPKIRLLKEDDKRSPYPLSWEEQDRLFHTLPVYLQRMALFKVNTGCRDQEVCRLRWEWEVTVPELNTSVFIIPKSSLINGVKQHNVKNGEDRLVVLNDIAKKMIEEVRGLHPEYVFTCIYGNKRKPLTSMDCTSWKKIRKWVGLPQARIHDLKHTFGRRLRAAGVALEDRQDLLGHKSGRITTHYSAAEIKNLVDAANKVCGNRTSTPTLTLLRCQPQIKTPTISPPGHRGFLQIVK